MRAVTGDDVCVSNYALDRWFAGELSGDESGALREHLASCARCSQRRDELSRQRAAFYQRSASWNAFAARQKRAQPARNPRPAWAVSLVAAAGALALWFGGDFGSQQQQEVSRDRAVRRKGGPSIGFYVKHGEQIRRGSAGEVVIPGELLRFTYSSERPAYFALLHADATRARVHFPVRAEADRIDPGRDVPLDFSIRLDSSLGAERVYGLFCEEPIALEPVRAQLERSGEVPALPRCSVDRLVLDKRPR